MSPYFFSLSLYPWTDLNDCHTPLQKELSSVSGVTLRKDAGGGNPATRSHGAQGTLQSSCSPETPPSFRGTRVGSAAGGSPGSGDCGLMQTGTGGPDPWGGGLFAWPTLPSALSPRTAQLGVPACSDSRGVTQPRSPRPEGNRVSSSFLFFKKCFIFLNCSLQVSYLVVACMAT